MARQLKKPLGRISDEMLDELLAGEDPAEAFRNGDLLAEMRKAVAERALNAEMAVHLDREPERESGNHGSVRISVCGGHTSEGRSRPANDCDSTPLEWDCNPVC